MFTARLLRGSIPRTLRPLTQRTLTTIRPPARHTTRIVTAAEKRAEAAASKRRQAVLTFGCILSMSAIWIITHTVQIQAESLPSSSTSAGAGPPITPGTPVILATRAEKAAGVELVPSGTTSVPAFPKTLRMHAEAGEGEGTEYALVGLGIRTVSFLSIEVYVVGVYIAADDLARLQAALVRRVHPTASAATQGEREALRRLLGDPVEGERFFEELLRDCGVRSLLRIVPTRNTDYQHLRDGWVRGIQARSSKSPLYDDDAFSTSLTHFKAAFGQKKTVPKQKVLLLVRDASGGLKCFYDGSGRNDGKVGGKGEKKEVQLLGKVEDKRLSTALWLCYLAGTKVASEPARKSVIEGLMALAERPIGTVGSTMA